MLALSVLSLAGSAAAGQITITFQGLDAVYDGFDLYDSGSPFGGNQDPAESDPLTSASLYDDGVLVGALNADIHADFAIVGVGDSPAGGGTAHLSDLLDDGMWLTGFDASGRGSVPEPSRLLLVGLGCRGLVAIRRVRRPRLGPEPWASGLVLPTPPPSDWPPPPATERRA
jgi:hypothetical protein